jgi:ribonuclease BN (tRNA processing enzyme)
VVPNPAIRIPLPPSRPLARSWEGAGQGPLSSTYAFRLSCSPRHDDCVQVHFVGSGDAFGSGGRYQTCIKVTSADQVVLVDCGATSLAALRAQDIDPQSVDAVTLTHLHGDHFGGLPFLILDGQFSRRNRPLRIYGPPGTQARLTATMEALFPGSSDVSRRFAVPVVELEPGGSVDLGALRLRSWQVIHASGAPSLALRVDDGASSFAYSGDTEWTPALVQAADGAGLFAVEAYTFEKPVRYHLDYRTLEAQRPDIKAARTVLTHMSADMLGHLAEAEFPAAHDGLVLDV